MEDAVIRYFETGTVEEVNENNMVAPLRESVDQRFRLYYIVGKPFLLTVAAKIYEELLPHLRQRIEAANFEPQSIGPVIERELKTGLRDQFAEVKAMVSEAVLARIREVCGWPDDSAIQETVVIEGKDDDIPGFISKVKDFLGLENSISPIIERARISGNLRAEWMLSDVDIVLIDSEGIGHNLQDQTLSGRHLDHFYDVDAILLIDDGSRAFVGQAKNALRGIIDTGYAPKLFLVFSHLDQMDVEERADQVDELKSRLLNAKQALQNEGVTLSLNQLAVTALGSMNKSAPDNETLCELKALLRRVREKHQEHANCFIRPAYNYSAISENLTQASHAFRQYWRRVLHSEGGTGKPWQSIKAFNRRLAWGEEEYQELKPVAQLHLLLMKNLEAFINLPDRWAEPIGLTNQEASLAVLRQELSRKLLSWIRDLVVEQQRSDWEEGMELSGPGSAAKRSRLIYEIICDSAPEISEDHLSAFTDAVKKQIETSIDYCTNRGTLTEHE